MKRPACLLTIAFSVGCATYQDQRTPEELKRDTALWDRANAVRVTISAEQFKSCTSLGVVSERYGTGLTSNPNNGPMNGGTWEEKLLRVETVRLGGNAALMISPKEWSSAVAEWHKNMERAPLQYASRMPEESRLIGEAYRCDTPKP